MSYGRDWLERLHEDARRRIGGKPVDEIEEIDKVLQDLMNVVIANGFDITSPDCVALANDVRRLMRERNELMDRLREDRVTNMEELLDGIEQSAKSGCADDWTPQGEGYNNGLERATKLIYEFDGSIRRKIKKLVEWTPEHVDLKRISRVNYPRAFTKEYGEMYADGDDKCPFFSEAYLYNLLGKDDARTLLALIMGLLRSLDGDVDHD